MPETSAAPVLDAEFQVKPTSVLVVDDEDGIRRLFTRLLTAKGYSVSTAPDGLAAIEAVRTSPPDVVLLDVNMPNLNGFEVCRRLKRDLATRLTPVILVTGLNAREQRVEGLEAGADDFLNKPVDTHELMARVGAVARLKRYTDDLDSAASIIMTLAVMIETRDGYSEGHCHRMANYASALGRRLELPMDDIQALHRGGFLHDIGMLAIPDSVVHKSGALDSAEFQLIQSHTEIGDRLLANLRSLQKVRPIVRHHHERIDGRGYPDGLKGDDIPLVAQIMAVVDMYDAVTTRRPYQGAKSVNEAIELLREHADGGWQRVDLVEEFVALIVQGKLAI